MPYNNVPKEKWDAMDRCVKSVMSEQKIPKANAIAICHNSVMGKTEEGGEQNMSENDLEKAVWTTAYVNDLPDSSFAYVEPGEKDKDGKTTPRSKRHLPYKDKNGKVDAAHVRNALARLNQTQIPADAKSKAHAKLVAAAKEVGINVDESKKIDDLEGGEEKMEKTDETKVNATVEEKVEEKKVEKADEQPTKPVEEAKTEEVKTEEVKTETAKAEETPAETKTDEVVKTEKVEEQPKKEEVKVEETAKAKQTPKNGDECMMPDGKTKGQMKDGKCVMMTKVDDAPVLVQEDLSEKLDKFMEAVTQKFDEIKDLVKQAPADGAAGVETPKKEEAKVEAPKEEVKVEKTETVEKTDEVKKTTGASSEGASDEKLLKELQELKASVLKRLDKLENSPAPSKVVFSKAVGGEMNADDNKQQVDDRLVELEKKRDAGTITNVERDEAWDLIKQKKTLH